MAEEAVVTPEAEKIAPEGTVEAEIAKAPKTAEVIPESKEPQTVPLSVYLSLKDDVKDLKKEIKESKDSKKPSIIIGGVKELAEKYPDVDHEFIEDLLSSATTQAQEAIEKKYTPILQKQDEERKREAFDKAFEKVFTKALDENPDLPKTIDKEVVKTLALTPAYKNTPIAEILLKLYGSVEGKQSSENETRTGADRIDDVVNFEKITPEQKERVLADPDARKKYFAYLDTL